jgi:hypothetical protein
MNKICTFCGCKLGEAHHTLCDWEDTMEDGDEESVYGYAKMADIDTLIRAQYKIISLSRRDAEDLCCHLSLHSPQLEGFAITFDKSRTIVDTLICEYSDDPNRLQSCVEHVLDIWMSGEIEDWLKGRCYALEKIKEQV